MSPGTMAETSCNSRATLQGKSLTVQHDSPTTESSSVKLPVEPKFGKTVGEGRPSTHKMLPPEVLETCVTSPFLLIKICTDIRLASST